MEIKRLAATFGKLEQEQLELSPGLNLIEAPNESGKSTWTAFLRVMLYGLNTRDRSPNADKRRYLPWSGSAMEGVLEAATDLGDITLLRRTARANSPMGAFSAVYTGTAQAVTDLSAASCGETLLGVPQDVFERSAYIRQTGLAVDINVATRKANFEKTPAFAWLQEHCAEYGFILRYDKGKEDVTGYRFEPWHYRYVGQDAAKVCMEQGITYEEYVSAQPVWSAAGVPVGQVSQGSDQS